MVNSTIWEILSLMTPNIELAQMLASEINNTFLPAEEVAVITAAIANGTIVAEEILQTAQNARFIAIVLLIYFLIFV